MTRKHTVGRAGLLLLAIVPMIAPLLQGQSLRSEREVSGVVLDSHREPLRGAVVQLENESTTAVTTFLTDPDGHYSFKHVGTVDDYRLSATYRGHRSKSKELSKFSSKTAPVIRLIVRLR